MAEENLKENLKLEQLADLREKTEMVSQLLLNQLKGHLDTLRPLLAPRRILAGQSTVGRRAMQGGPPKLAPCEPRRRPLARGLAD